MTDLSSTTNCDTFKEHRSAMPLLAAYEFMEISRNDVPEYNVFESFAQSKNWFCDFNKIKRFLQDRKNTIVVTCEKQKIEWVSKGFSRMTGYESEEAIGQYPKFLQGPETSETSKMAIREKIKSQEKYSGRIINYRKNGEKYICKVDILPMYDTAGKLVNFVAFEHEVESL
ncbi:MAG: PAS domain-containing protein [Arcicella sp.]|jgi:PAS domain S-box-containing protein|nr:PAS domain-containing protein [Arcicella sp.]